MEFSGFSAKSNAFDPKVSWSILFLLCKSPRGIIPAKANSVSATSTSSLEIGTEATGLAERSMQPFVLILVFFILSFLSVSIPFTKLFNLFAPDKAADADSQLRFLIAERSFLGTEAGSTVLESPKIFLGNLNFLELAIQQRSSS
uniref:Uncharacterized protein n=1 Tax=Opuntia streptacantha TaxID=393608 RepID=A0A7C8YXR2_OPUST